MKLSFDRFLLVTNSFPLEFDSISEAGEMTDNIQNAQLYKTQKDVENELGNFDFPENYQALPIKITYEF